jgi:hypothetical protein
MECAWVAQDQRWPCGRRLGNEPTTPSDKRRMHQQRRVQPPATDAIGRYRVIGFRAQEARSDLCASVHSMG